MAEYTQESISAGSTWQANLYKRPPVLTYHLFQDTIVGSIKAVHLKYLLLYKATNSISIMYSPFIRVIRTVLITGVLICRRFGTVFLQFIKGGWPANTNITHTINNNIDNVDKIDPVPVLPTKLTLIHWKWNMPLGLPLGNFWEQVFGVVHYRQLLLLNNLFKAWPL